MTIVYTFTLTPSAGCFIDIHNPISGSEDVEVYVPVVFDVVDTISFVESTVVLTITENGADTIIPVDGSDARVTSTDISGGKRYVFKTIFKYNAAVVINVGYTPFLAAAETCSESINFRIESPGFFPAGEYKFNYDIGINIPIDKVGSRVNVGSSQNSIKYSNVDTLPEVPPPYGAGYVYGDSLNLDGVIADFRLMSRSIDNDNLNDSLGLSPRISANRLFPFDTNDDTLMLMGFENCIDNEAKFLSKFNDIFLTDGKFGQAAFFIKDPFTIENLGIFFVNQGTIEMWLKPNCFTGDGRNYIIDMQPFVSSGTNIERFSLYIQDSEFLIFEIVSFAQDVGGELRRDVYSIKTPITAKNFDVTEFNFVALRWRNNINDVGSNLMSMFVNGKKIGFLKYGAGGFWNVPALTAGEILAGTYQDKAHKFRTLQMTKVKNPDTQEFYAPTVNGMKEYFEDFVVGKEVRTYDDDFNVVATSIPFPVFSDAEFTRWLGFVNNTPSQTYDAEPTQFVDAIGVTPPVLDIVGEFIDIGPDFSRIFVGADFNSNNLAFAAIDNIRFSADFKSDEELLLDFKSATPLANQVGQTTLLLDFDEKLQKDVGFTFLNSEIGSRFEFEVNVLNPFNFPLDKELITTLLNTIKPVNTRVFVNFP